MKIAEFLEEGLEDNTTYDSEELAKLDLNGKKTNFASRGKEFLKFISKELNKKLLDENFRKSNLITFGEEFEFADDLYFLKVRLNSEDYSFANLNIQTGNVIGKINSNYDDYSYTLKIKSRFGNQFFQYLLAYAEGFLELEDLGAYSEENDLYWALIYLWKSKLKQAYRSGLPKLYETKQKELNKIKGGLNLKEQFKKPYDNGQYHCQYREHSYDNQVTRIIAYTFNLLFKKHQKLLSDVFRLKNVFNQVCNQPKISLEDLEQVNLSNPYYRDYREVLELSKKIIKQEAISIRSSDADFSGFLFDISLLFEHHIRKLIKEEITEIKMWDKTELKMNSGGRTRKLIPDIIIEKDNDLFVYDVKYKKFKTRVKREDMFQIVTYAAKLASRNDYNLKGCGFIYPHGYKNEENKKDIISEELNLFTELDFNILFYEIPQDKECTKEEDYTLDFKGFKETMGENNKKFIDDLSATLNLSK